MIHISCTGRMQNTPRTQKQQSFKKSMVEYMQKGTRKTQARRRWIAVGQTDISQADTYCDYADVFHTRISR